MRVLLAALGLALGVCAAGAAFADAESSVSSHRVVTPCTKAETRSALVSFVRAFNAGDDRQLNRLFAGRSWFRWYSSSAPGVRVGAQAQQRRTLIGYFKQRHAQRDRIRLSSFRFTGNANGYGNFTWKLERSAADFRAGAWFVTEAKGAVICWDADARFIVLSIGSPES